MQPPARVLFVCIHNSARSQMAEAFLNQLGDGKFEAHSAGLEPGTLNPLVVEVMKEIDIDISKQSTQSVFELFKNGELFSYVITVCDAEVAEQCPVFPGLTTRLHWSFPDPSALAGSREEKLQRTREIRDAIREKISSWVAQQAGEKAA